MTSAIRRALGASATAAIGLTTVLAFANPASAATNTGTPTAQPGKPGVIDIFNVNDFHGRIDTDYTGNLGLSFACTLESSKATYGDANSIFLSAGDNIGASPFTSSSQDDNPTIDFLNALELRASAVGNHEFDKGYTDLTERVDPRAQFAHLGANVYLAGTTTPALDEYKIIEVNGVSVGIIGAVTKQTPSLTGPNATGTLTFGDPVAAVNRVAAQLSDGDTTNGEADVIIAEYHEGATAGDPSTLQEQVATGGAFASIVNDTSSEVDAIFTAHTHKTYVWDGPVPDSDGTRPVIQSGSYANPLGHVQLTYDAVTDTVTSYAAQNITVPSTPGASCPKTDPQYIAASQVVTAAVAQAKAIGQQPIGQVTDDITTAYADGKRDDRLSESTLSNLIAQSMVEVLKEPGRSGADIGVMNPGGVRAELLYDDGANKTGEITYGEAAAVTPFANTLQTIELTGEQFKTVLEQQWQRDKNGVPLTSGRPYLKLGLSENVTYTFDPDRALNDRITSITINGEPIDPAATYTIVGASFLIGGGDNFWEFRNGANMKDSGLIDTESFINWIDTNSPVSPDFAKQAVTVRELPTTVQAGTALSFQAQGFDLTSLGSPTNTGGKVMLNGVEIGTFQIVAGQTIVTSTIPNVAGAGGVATIDTIVPADTPAGPATLQLVADPSGTTVTIPITVTAAALEPAITIDSPVQAGGQTQVTVTGFPANTVVDIAVDGVLIEQVTTDANGSFTGTLTVPTDVVGTHTITATAGGLTASAQFEVTAASSPSPSPGDDDDDSAATPTPAPKDPAGTKGGSGGPAQKIAYTGTDAAPQLGLAALLLGAGAALAVLGRRRKA
ncbi:bifunctional UDP-sugar hydrolase/5'-nucleotidase [Blastococcus sp. Marseille-P5729]|uniref:bifunctional metallophosphatase/5'-nucleotidase n=1 Tax=Blastococcus sp. Marseille-P5729 TaxID=2086582 RepID=UPI000D10952D|nr:5'-nucleotidase C-terminal domain-containing protein [Blastococcus sp. Marseille-P5729]